MRQRVLPLLYLLIYPLIYPFDLPFNASLNAAAGFVASSTREPLAHELIRWECKLPTTNGEIVSAIETYPG